MADAYAFKFGSLFSSLWTASSGLINVRTLTYSWHRPFLRRSYLLRALSLTPSAIGPLTRLLLNYNPVLFSDKLKYLYSGKGFGHAFEFLFGNNEENSPEGEAEEAHNAKLSRDLVYMWRLRL